MTLLIVCNNFFWLYMTKVLLGNFFFFILVNWHVSGDLTQPLRCVVLFNIPMRWKIAKIYRNLTTTYICIAVQLSEGEGWDINNQFNPASFLCLSHAKTGFATSHAIVFVVFSEFRWLFVFVDIGEIVDHHCLNFLFIKQC